MIVTGSLFESECITCARYEKIEILSGEKVVDERLIIISMPKQLLFYTEQFQYLAKVKFNEVIVQLEFVNFTHNLTKELVILTYSQKLVVCHVQLVQTQIEIEDDQSSFNVDLEIIHIFDLNDEIKHNFDVIDGEQVRMFNYEQYLVMDSRYFWIVILKNKIVKIPKQGISRLLPIASSLIYELTNRPQVLISNDSHKFTIKKQESSLFDYIFLQISDEQYLSELSLFGYTAQNLQKTVVKSFSLGFFVDEAYLISKVKPFYLLESIEEGLIRILDFKEQNIIHTVQQSFDIHNVFPFESEIGCLISCRNFKEPLALVFQDFLKIQSLSLQIQITSAIFIDFDNIFLGSNLQDSYFISKNKIIKTFKNIGPIIYLNEIKLLQNQILLTSRSDKSTHIFKKGIKVSRIISTLRLPQNKQIPKKLFLLKSEKVIYALFTFPENSIIFKFNNEVSTFSNIQSQINEETLTFEMLKENYFVQVTPKNLILIINGKNYPHSFATCIYHSLVYQNFVYSIDEGNFIQIQQIDNNQVKQIKKSQKIAGKVKNMVCSGGGLVISFWWNFGNIVLVGNDLNVKTVELGHNETITSMLFNESNLLIAYDSGNVDQFEVNFQKGLVNKLQTIKITQQSNLLLYNHIGSQVISLSSQLFMIDYKKNQNLNINWDGVEDIAVCGNFILGRNSQRQIQLVELDSGESQYCQIMESQKQVNYFGLLQELYFIITNEEIIIYEESPSQPKFIVELNMTVYNIRIFQNILYLCGSKNDLQETKRGILNTIFFDSQNKIQVTTKSQEQIIQDIIVNQKNFWMLQQNQIKCFSQPLQYNSKPTIKHNFQIPLVGFDISSDFLLVYDQIRSVSVFKIIFSENKLIATGQSYQSVYKSIFVGDGNSIINFEKSGRITLSQLNLMTIGITDNMTQVMSSYTAPVFCAELNNRKDKVIYGTIFGKLGFIRYLEQFDYGLLRIVQKTLIEKLNILTFDNKKQENEVIDYNILKEGRSIQIKDLNLTKNQENEWTELLDFIEKKLF